MDNASELYDALRVPGAVEGLINTHAKETVFLEFKTSRQPMSSDDKVNLSLAVAGFANSGGGVIIWGIEGKNEASKPALIADVDSFIEEVNSVLPNAVVPHHSVQMHSVKIIDTAGFVMMYVPQSDRAPHRAQLSATRGYYKRVQDSFRQMEHYDLEDMFGRRQRPVIVPTFEVRRGSYDHLRIEGKDPTCYWRPLGITVYLNNEGRAVGKHVTLELAFPTQYALQNSAHMLPGATYPDIVPGIGGPVARLREFPGVVYPEVPNPAIAFWACPPRSIAAEDHVICWRVLAEHMSKQEGRYPLGEFLR